MKVEVVVERDDRGRYVGTVRDLPGCRARASSREELREAMRESLARWGEVLEFVDVETVEVGTEDE